MTPQNFKNWLEGYFNLTIEPINTNQAHINSVLKRIEDPLDFCYYLQGYFELNTNLTLSRWESIVKQHLDLVFTKITNADKSIDDNVNKVKKFNEWYHEKINVNDSSLPYQPLIATC